VCANDRSLGLYADGRGLWWASGAEDADRTSFGGVDYHARCGEGPRLATRIGKQDREHEVGSLAEPKHIAKAPAYF